MGAFDLHQKSQKAFVSNQNLSASQEITYTHNKSQAVDIVNAFIEVISYRDKDKKDRIDEAVFSNVLLTEPPKRKDYINYNGEVHIVDSFTKDGELYEIYTTSNEARRNGRFMQ